ncbi:MAG: hypothetical protein E7585_08760 [Ruminococcaceae bacterium]|nr:hypothetical protein [Oscillospiraceae bacterium]
MRKRSLLALFTALLCFLCVFVLAACDEDDVGNGADPTHTHAWGEWTTTTPATCTAAGVQTRTCACGESETQPIAAMGEHNYNTSNICAKCGYVMQYSSSLVFECNQEGTAYTVVDMIAENPTSIIIPNYYNELPVIGIERGALDVGVVTELLIPASITVIEDSPFDDGYALSHIRVEKGNEVYYSANDCLIEKASKTLILGCKNSVIPTDGSVIAIGDWAFTGCVNLTSITIPANVMNIGRYAFEACEKLIEVCNYSSIDVSGCFRNAKNIYTSSNAGSKLFVDEEGYIFYDDINCYLMGYTGTDTVLTLPTNCKGKNYEIHELAFWDLGNIITSVIVPAGVSGIGHDIFYNGESEIPIHISDLSSWCNIDFKYPLEGGNLYLNGSPLTHLVIPNAVGNINDYAFRGCTTIISVTISDNVQSIGDYAFSYCTGLTIINYRGTEAQWNAISKGSKWDYNTGDYTIVYNYTED